MPHSQVQSLFLTIREYCALYRKSRATVYRELARGEIAAVRDGARTKILADSARAHNESLPRYRPHRAG